MKSFKIFLGGTYQRQQMIDYPIFLQRMNIRRTIGWWVSLFIAILWVGCSDKEPVPDISDIKVSIPVVRFEEVLFAIDTNHIQKGIEQLEQQYPDFCDLYFKEVLNLKPDWDTAQLYYRVMDGFLKEPAMRGLAADVSDEFGDLAKAKEAIETAFRYYHHYFPEETLPTLYTMISQFGVGVGVGDESLIVGLDMFLGEDYEAYAGIPNMYQYILRSQNQKHLPAKVMYAWVDDKVGPPNGNRLLDEMINNGKKWVLLDRLFPHEQDTILFDYTGTQLAWCEQNQRDIWAYLIAEDLLYSNKRLDFRSYVDYAPTSAGMPSASPSRTANYMGYLIVKQWLNKTGKSLKDMIVEKDSQKILTESKFKPAR